MQLRRSLRAALSLCLVGAPAALADDNHSTVSVFLPFYSENWWKDMHGSIIKEVRCAEPPPGSSRVTAASWSDWGKNGG